MSTRTLLFAPVAGWLVVLLYAEGICTGYVLQRRTGLQTNENPVENVALLVGFGAFALVGGLLVAKRPTNAISWIMATIALMVGIFHAGDAYAAYVMVTRSQPDALAVAGAWSGSWYWYLALALVLVYLPLMFPDGRLPSSRWLPVAVLPGIGTLGVVILGALGETLPLNEAPGYEIDNPIGIEGLGFVEELPVFGVLTGLLFVAIVGAVAGSRVPADEVIRLRGSAPGAPPAGAPSGGGCASGDRRQRAVCGGPHRAAHCHRDRGAEVPPLRDRPPHKPRPRLRSSHGGVGCCLLRERGRPAGRLARLQRPGVHPRGGGLHLGDSGPIQPAASTGPSVRR